MGSREHIYWHGATHLDTRALKVPFLAKINKMSLVNLGLTKGQIRSNPRKTIFFMVLYQTRATQRFLATLTKFNPDLTPSGP